MSGIRNKKILFVHSSDEMYGADLILLELVRALLAESVTCVVILPTDLPYQGELGHALEIAGADVIRMDLAVIRRRYFTVTGGFKFLKKLCKSVLDTCRIIAERQIDVVHNNTLAVLPGAIAARIKSVPCVWHVHEIIIKPALVWRVTSLLAGFLSTKNVCVSEQTMSRLCDGYSRNEGKTSVIYNGLDLQRFELEKDCRDLVRSKWGVVRDEVLIGMVGRISKWKGQDYFVDVANDLLKRNSKLKFVIVGGAPLSEEYLQNELEQKIEASGKKEQFILNGFREDVPAVLSAIDIFVMPSTQPDPLPTVVLEAMASSRPVVANAHGGSIEMVDDAETGFLVSPGMVSEMSRAISKLAGSPELRFEMGMSGRQRIETRFSKHQHIHSWMELYRSML